MIWSNNNHSWGKVVAKNNYTALLPASETPLELSLGLVVVVVMVSCLASHLVVGFHEIAPPLE
jgi:hypothetical protein